MIAVNTIRREPHYRRHAFDAGLKALGYTLAADGQPKSRADVLVTWNRQLADEGRADQWERDGGTVIVAENAYLDPAKWSMYAISAHGHNGSGRFPVGDEDRFLRLGVTLEPWRSGGGHVLVCGQRGIGSRTMASPPQWEVRVAKQVRAMGMVNVKIRQHPGRYAPATTLEDDLRAASLCLVWSSACGVKALAMGVPVVYCASHWICEAAARFGLEGLAAPTRDDTRRRAAMHKMSHGQWTVAEIEAGIPFRRIMEQIGA